MDTKPGDTNGDGFTDMRDLNNVRNNFGAGRVGVQPVPEPSTAILLIIGIAMTYACRRGRRETDHRC